MNCRKVNHFLSAYIDGELPGVEHRQIHDHIHVCSECRSEYEALLNMKRLLAAMRVRQPQNDISQTILKRVHEPETLRPVLPAWLDCALDWVRTPIPTPYLALSATLAIVGILTLSRAVTARDPISMPPYSSTTTQYPVQVEEIDTRTPELYSHTLPIINVGLHQPSATGPRYYTDFGSPQFYPDHTGDNLFLSAPPR